MRTLVVILEQLVPISGGGTPRIRSVIDVLIERGHEVSVATSVAVGITDALKILNCEKLFPLKNVNRLDKNKMKKYLIFHPFNISKVVHEAGRLKPDLIIAHNSLAGLAAILAKKVTKSLTVVDMTDLLFEYLSSYDNRGWASQMQRIGEKLENKVIRESDRVLTISNAMKKILIHKGAKEEKVDVVYDGVKNNLFIPHRKDAIKLRQKYAAGFENVVMYHGVIDPQDHPEIIVDAAAKVVDEHPNTIFWIIGDGAAIPNVKERIKRKGVEKHFFFSGWIPFEHVPTFVSACDIGLVILPDISSARIRVTLKGFEYWSCGKPIVVSDLPALREVVEPWQTGLFYKPGDPRDLAKKICMFLDNRRLSRKIGEAGLKLVKEKYSWNKLAAQFVSICEGMFNI